MTFSDFALLCWTEQWPHFVSSAFMGLLVYSSTSITLSVLSNFFSLGRLRHWPTLPDARYIGLCSFWLGLFAAVAVHLVWDGLF